MRLLVDTGVFSASLSQRGRTGYDRLVARLTGHQLFLAAPTVAELRLSCRRIGHPLAGSTHSSDLWIGASAIGIRAVLITADQIFASTAGLSIG